jgi:hypothetical protein
MPAAGGETAIQVFEIIGKSAFAKARGLISSQPRCGAGCSGMTSAIGRTETPVALSLFCPNIQGVCGFQGAIVCS